MDHTQLRQNATPLVKRILETEETYATVLFILVHDKLGAIRDDEDGSWVTWAPETIRMVVNEHFGATISDDNFNRLMAAVALVTSNEFYKQEDTFVKLANVLGGDDFDPGVFEPADSIECAWAITEAFLLAPPDFDEDPEPFSDGVRTYIGEVLKMEGYIKPPDVLGIALNADWEGQVSSEFADDPTMFSAINETQMSKTTELNAMLQEGVNSLILQIEALPLDNGSTKDVVEKARRALEQVKAGVREQRDALHY